MKGRLISGGAPVLVAGVSVIAAACIFMVVVVTPMAVDEQALLGFACFLAAMLLNRRPGRWPALVLMGLSVTMSIRYLWWRLTDTIDFDNALDAFFGIGLLLAEVYAVLVLLLGYFQTAWPLARKSVSLPTDSRVWPEVDIFIPTYNEPLDVVRQTVFCAKGLDWPAAKMNIHVLDDGRREDFRQFCEQVGVHYRTRSDNRHAKAGNINAALLETHAEYVAIFDCDHVPTRSFLQVTMGWFLRDAKLSMLQTPHVFFSPDPFEKNLSTFRSTPNEGELFYGLIQDGNDLWNATFFCGSCAVIRRSALMEVGGIAVETVTEDAHTALKLSRLGYNTAYLAVGQAAGLATESLSGHIGQRIRWARGMAQIARLDNPLFGPGLRLGQRLCYFNAVLHFFYGLPRIVFMTAPLAYLLAGAHVFQATGLLILSYALPHLMLAMLTNSRIQGRFRHSFWNEVYESVLAWYILRPVVVAFINPRLGKFNVTAKGGVIEKAYVDWPIAAPYVVLLLLNLAGIVVGVMRLHGADSMVTSTLLINILWTAYNLLIASACLAVAAESRQLRQQPRVNADLSASLSSGDGHTTVCRTVDFSQFGLSLELSSANTPAAVGDLVQVGLFRNEEESMFPARVVSLDGRRMGLHFEPLTVAQHVELAQLTFGRSNNWTGAHASHRNDSPLRAFAEVAQVGGRGFSMLFREGFRRLSRTRRDSAVVPNGASDAAG